MPVYRLATPSCDGGWSGYQESNPAWEVGSLLGHHDHSRKMNGHRTGSATLYSIRVSKVARAVSSSRSRPRCTELPPSGSLCCCNQLDPLSRNSLSNMQKMHGARTQSASIQSLSTASLRKSIRLDCRQSNSKWKAAARKSSCRTCDMARSSLPYLSAMTEDGVPMTQ